MHEKSILSMLLVLLLLTSCAVPAVSKGSAHEGYVDAVVVVPSLEEQAERPVASEELEEAPVSEQTPPKKAESENSKKESTSVKENDFTENGPDEIPENESGREPAEEIPPLQAESAALSSAPAAVPEIVTPEAGGIDVKKSERAVIDYSYPQEGYVMICFTAQTDKRLKAQVKGPVTTYTYNLTAGTWEVFPLSDGNGAYQVTVFENVVDNKYAAEISVSFDVTLENEFAPYLLPNQYVNYRPGSQTVRKAAELIGTETDALKKVELVYDYVVDTLTYDIQKAATVQSGYLPELDTVLEKKTGICFDYAALMAGMLRSQQVPCKLVVGYAGTAYHAWISVWSEETGWVDGVIFFDGSAWQRMDPTFASSGGKSESIMQFIGDGTNYTAKYIY